MDILVFTTNVTDEKQVSRVSALLTHLPTVHDWNFDLDDCDNILRVVAHNIPARYIERLLLTAGVNCRELE